MAKLIVLQHVSMEGPCRIRDVARRRGLELDVLPLHTGAAVPPSVSPDDVLVVMGGPMGVEDVGDPRYPFLAAEVDLLRDRIARDLPTLGICLGAQLIAHAAGARVFPNVRTPAGGGEPQRVLEVGWAEVQFHGVGREPLLAGLREAELMLHWHGDTFDLPAGAVHLASTPFCRNQAFRLGRRIVALQFHAEVDAEAVARWAVEDAAYLARANGPTAHERLRADTASILPAWHAVGDRLLANALDVLLAP